MLIFALQTYRMVIYRQYVSGYDLFLIITLFQDFNLETIPFTGFYMKRHCIHRRPPFRAGPPNISVGPNRPTTS